MQIGHNVKNQANVLHDYVEKSLLCFKIKEDCIKNLMDKNKYKSLCYDKKESQICDGYSSFWKRKKEAYHILNFLVTLQVSHLFMKESMQSKYI